MTAEGIVMTDLVQKIADSVREEQRKAAAAGQLDDIEGAIRQALASQPKERREAVARIERNMSGQIRIVCPNGDAFDMSAHVGRTLYAHPAPGRVAELEGEIRFSNDAIREYMARIAALESQLAEANGEIAEIAAALPGPVYMDLPDGGCTSIAEQVRRMAADVDATRKQLTESREREGRLADVAAHCETAFGSIHEYWNRDTNEDAMADALTYAIDTSRLALEKIAALAAKQEKNDE